AINKFSLKTGELIDTDLIIIGIDVTPNTKFAKEIGIDIGDSGAIQANKYLETKIPHIYAIDDSAESYNLVTGNPIYRPLGSTANKMGRILGARLTGGNLEHKGILGTGIVRVFDMTIAQTGLTEKEAIDLDIDIDVLHNVKP